MLKKIQLSNFKKFDNYTVHLKAGNILVGPNNSGKTTIIDSVRIIDSCLRYARRRSPQILQLDDGRIFDGHIVPEGKIVSNLINSIHNYNDDDAEISLESADGSIATVLLNRVRPVRFFIDAQGARLTTAQRFMRAFPVKFTIVPTLGPLEENERWVEDETIRKGELSRLSSRHLRNVWLRESLEEFQNFAAEVADAWQDITISKPERQVGNPQFLEMFFSENRLDREIFWSGLGFQIWLQLLTHIRRAGGGGIIVIDEPDIYLHPEVQKRLLNLVRHNSAQFILATHSIEMVNDAEPLEIVSIDPKYRNSKRIKSEEDYNRVYGYLGSSQNVELVRIAKARRVIFVEGKDKKLISIFAKRFRFNHILSGSVPFVELGGFGGWEKAKSAVWTFREILDLEVGIFCVFDRDYRSENEIVVFIEEFRKDKIPCVVLERKEIENYLLDLHAIEIAVERRAREREVDPITYDDIVIFLDGITQEIRPRIWAATEEELRNFARRNKVPAENFEQVRESFDRRWENFSERLKLVPGKEICRKLNEFLQDHGIGALTPLMILNSMADDDLDPGIRSLLQSLDEFCR